MSAYIPGPPERPLLIRPIRGLGNFTPVALLGLLAIAGPAVVGVCVLVEEVAAALGRW